MGEFSKADLDDFVAAVDARGGPSTDAARAYWDGLRYRPVLQVDTSLDPFGEAYVGAQVALYGEISGRALDQAANEMSEFNVDHHAGAANAYAVADPSAFVTHYLRLGHLVKRAGLPAQARVLDMGAGWGMSSEFLALLGCKVTAVDINPKFVELIRRRSARLGLPIAAHQGTFDDYRDERLYDAVLFYECLHHAVRPWAVIDRMAGMLTAKGAILLAGEPINDFWPSWGLRTDPLSVYCIRKFGWFESGWSLPFLIQCLQRAGLQADVRNHDNAEIGWTIVARSGAEKTDLSIDDLAGLAASGEWYRERQSLIAKGDSRLSLIAAGEGRSLRIGISNNRPRQIALKVTCGGETRLSTILDPGRVEIAVPLKAGQNELRFVSDAWLPSEELGNGDPRRLSFHVTAAGVMHRAPTE